ncbi:MAG: hypothetical protein ACJAUH_002927 [Saprospiraceae bacterium]|jgi:hypothetical protein|tara:strand:- start:126 stop:524 length:399 start_codon:yes stop_codon:yes gene_type:complete
MKKTLIFIAMFITIYSCCKDPIDPCTENTRVRFHNGSGVDLKDIYFFGNEIGALANDETSGYIIINSDTLQSDGRELSRDFWIRAWNRTARTSPQKPHEFSQTPNCFTYVITNVDTVQVFSSNTLSYTILLE